MAGLFGAVGTPQYSTSATATMVNGNTIFTVAGGPILIQGLISTCITANNGTASTLQYSVTPTTSAGAQTISAASASLASAAAGATVSLQGTALSTAALLGANGPNVADRLSVVRALQRAGMADEASAFAIEGMVLMQGYSAPPLAPKPVAKPSPAKPAAKAARKAK